MSVVMVVMLLLCKKGAIDCWMQIDANKHMSILHGAYHEGTTCMETVFFLSSVLCAVVFGLHLYSLHTYLPT